MAGPLAGAPVIVLNGAPRSGKSSIAAALRRRSPGRWVARGVDSSMAATAPEHLPGIGLRPGGERPDLEPLVARLFRELYEDVADLSRAGQAVVVDVGHHDGYSRPLGTLADAARRLAGLPALLVGVRCPVDVVLERRAASGSGTYATAEPGGAVPAVVLRWQAAVHDPGIYDLEVDTSVLSPDECAIAVEALVAAPPSPTALERLRA